MTKQTNKPVDTIRLGRISASIWERKTDSGTFYSFSIQRTYTDSDGKFQNSTSFNLGDALTVAKIADTAHTKIYELLKAQGVNTETVEETDDTVADTDA